MQKQSCVVDTDVFIDLLRGHAPVLPFFQDIEKNKFDASVSVITVMELMAGNSTKSIEEQVKIRDILSLFKIVNVDYELAQRAGFLCRDHGMAFADALIAATAHSLKNNTIVTKNKKHYQMIEGLKIVSPY